MVEFIVVFPRDRGGRKREEEGELVTNSYLEFVWENSRGVDIYYISFYRIWETLTTGLGASLKNMSNLAEAIRHCQRCWCPSPETNALVFDARRAIETFNLQAPPYSSYSCRYPNPR